MLLRTLISSEWKTMHRQLEESSMVEGVSLIDTGLPMAS